MRPVGRPRHAQPHSRHLINSPPKEGATRGVHTTTPAEGDGCPPWRGRATGRPPQTDGRRRLPQTQMTFGRCPDEGSPGTHPRCAPAAASTHTPAAAPARPTRPRAQRGHAPPPEAGRRRFRARLFPQWRGPRWRRTPADAPAGRCVAAAGAAVGRGRRTGRGAAPARVGGSSVDGWPQRLRPRSARREFARGVPRVRGGRDHADHGRRARATGWQRIRTVHG